MGALGLKSKVRIKSGCGYDGATGYITEDLDIKTAHVRKYMAPERVRYFRVQLIDRPHLPAMTFADEELEPA